MRTISVVGAQKSPKQEGRRGLEKDGLREREDRKEGILLPFPDFLSPLNNREHQIFMAQRPRNLQRIAQKQRVSQASRNPSAKSVLSHRREWASLAAASRPRRGLCSGNLCLQEPHSVQSDTPTGPLNIFKRTSVLGLGLRVNQAVRPSSVPFTPSSSVYGPGPLTPSLA